MHPKIDRSSRGLDKLRPPGSFDKGESTTGTRQFWSGGSGYGTGLNRAAGCDRQVQAGREPSSFFPDYAYKRNYRAGQQSEN